MGQYWKVVFLNDSKDAIRFSMDPFPGSKLMEHAFLEDSFLHKVERLLCPGGLFYKTSLVWTGDYSQVNGHNLYHDSDQVDPIEIKFRTNFDTEAQPYIVNHDTKQQVNKFACKTNKNFNVHPLPLLVAEGNGLGSGDFRGHDESKVGLWSRSVISMEPKPPQGYSELNVSFYES